MPRAKGGFKTRRSHKKVLKLAKGYRGTRNRLFTRAKQAVLRAGEHAFGGRRIRRRDLRSLWIARINAALKTHNINYSTFIKGLKLANIDLNRKVLSEMAISEPSAFERVVENVKKSLK